MTIQSKLAAPPTLDGLTGPCGSVSEHYDVLIVGGGVSGISAAHSVVLNAKRLKHNLRFAVLEAQNYLGGRTLTQKFGNGIVELGAGWIHGAHQGNNVFNLAASYGLIRKPLLICDRKAGAFLHSSGRAIDQKFCSELYEEFRTIVYGAGELEDEDERTFEKYVDDSVAMLKTKYARKWHGVIDGAALFTKQEIAVHGGDACTLMAAWGMGHWNNFEMPGDVTIEGGYSALISKMVIEIGEQHFLMEEPITNIDWTKFPVQVKTSKASYTCDHLILTLPLGVLKATHQTLFKPELPHDKVEAIQTMGFGRVTKVFLQFEHPFWQPGMLNCLKFYPDPMDREKIREKMGNPFIDFVNGFEEVPTSKDVLLAWITGDDNNKLAEYSQEQIRLFCSELLRIYTGDPSIPDADKILLTGWGSNEYIRGSYSYPTSDTEGPEDYEKIGEPLAIKGKNRIFFAGEATHPFYYASVHGARLRGIEAAMTILKTMIDDT